MKRLALIAAGLSLALVPGDVGAKTLSERGEARLAKMLEGRSAGEARVCIPTMRGFGDSLEVIDRVALVYDAGKTVWVARPRDPRMLDSSDVLVMKRFNTSTLCAMEQMYTVDRSTGMFSGVVWIDEFVPYTKEG